MSIAAMERETKNQPEDLARFCDWLQRGPISTVNPPRTIFAGSGDSYAAAMFAREVSKGSALAEDPYEMLAKPALGRKRSLVLISVSGRTRANIELARRFRGEAKKRVAITSDSESPLARICDSSIVLQYRKAGGLTPGTASFTTSLLACARLLGRSPRRLRLEASLKNAREWARGVRLSGHGLCLFVGSGVDRALAEYGACKIQEVLGMKASAAYPEQVGHAQLFSLDPASDTVVCIDSEGKGRIGELSKEMSRSGFRTHRISLKGEDIVAKSLAISFYLQHLALFNARRRVMSECAFLRDKARLLLSNRLIY